MKTYKCNLCGQVFNVEDGQELVCPVCGAHEDKLVEVKAKKNPYEGTQTLLLNSFLLMFLHKDFSFLV